ncbi:unnamed protein product [Diatraea saccharalis]|uniref:Uncharacterized protein n=1 Tax=Diatraea saccharalis TaxID=40085 RepID=A0A9N9R3T7_9NEOP|nr:unnamed protein product [Diatraea saccharalis]
MIRVVLKTVIYLILTIASVTGRIHKLLLLDDERHYVELTTFGFFQGGILDVRMVNFMLPSSVPRGEYGFTLDRTVNDAINPYLESHSDTCFLKDVDSIGITPQHTAIVFLKLDFANMRLNITCNGEVSALHLYQNRSMIPIDRIKRQSQYMFINRRKRSVDSKSVNAAPQCSYANLQITKATRNGFDYYNTSFAMLVASQKEEGLYNLYFHNCPHPGKTAVTPVNTVVSYIAIVTLFKTQH